MDQTMRKIICYKSYEAKSYATTYLQGCAWRIQRHLKLPKISINQESSLLRKNLSSYECQISSPSRFLSFTWILLYHTHIFLPPTPANSKWAFDVSHLTRGCEVFERFNWPLFSTLGHSKQM